MRPSLCGQGAWIVLLGLAAGCASDSPVPRDLQARVDEKLSFSELKQSPQSYSGRLVVVGGEVLTAKLQKDGTRLEILQLPLESFYEPMRERTQSQGRFLAIYRTFLDPATVPAGTRVTITGEVLGATTLPLDETEYTYPILEIKHLKIWPRPEPRTVYRSPPFGPVWGPYGGWGYWRSPWYPYW